MSRKRFVDALEDSTSSDEDETVVTKAPKRKLTIDDLEKCGYKDRPSILFIPEPKQEVEQTPSHIKRDSRDQSKKQIEETIEEREATTYAVTEGVAEIADFVTKRMQHAEELLQERHKEQKKLAKSKRLTFNQKEKAKRSSGKTGNGKNFVEEEKRIGRNLGVYSGFDS